MEIKRVFDILISLCCMGFFFALAVLIAIAIKLSSKGPIFYPCRRVGRQGRIIYCWKFRTMCQDADKQLTALLENNPHLSEEWNLYFKLKNDPRISRLGKFLRRTSLDELPQFWNALKGDLSIVGPRPVTEEEVAKYFKEKAEKILSVRPGLTGIWQTSGRSLLTFDERIKLEEQYIDQQSLKLDLKIIFKTIPKLLFIRGAF